MKLKLAGLALVPAAAFVVACGPTTSSAPPVPAITHAAKLATPRVTTTPAPSTPVPVTTHTAIRPSSCHFRYENGNVLPDPLCTPGSVQSTSVTAICTSGWATAHREYFTKAEREVAFAKYGVVTVNPAGYGEYDHLIPLELGGSNNASNLWPEKGAIPNPKDEVENVLHEDVCSGHVGLVAAQQAIAADWTTAEKVISGATQSGTGMKAPAPAPKPVTTTAAPASHSCSPTSAAGNCYKAGELCPKADHGVSGTNASGATITCEDNNGWRWEA